MRLMLLHVDGFWYKVHRPAIKNPQLRDPPQELVEPLDNTIVVFVSIEEGDTEEIIHEVCDEILNYTETVKASSIVIYPYAHLSTNLAKPSKALRLLHKIVEIMSSKHENVYYAPFGWYKEFKLHCKGHPLSELSKTFLPGKEVKNKRWEAPWEWGDLPKTYAETFKRWGYGSQGWVSLLITDLARNAFHNMMIKRTSFLGNQPKLWISSINETIRGNKEELKELFSLLGISYEDSGDGVYHDKRLIAFCKNDSCEAMPLYYLTAVKIWEELKQAQQGKTPILPPQLAPVHLYIVSMPETRDYVIELLDDDLSKNYRIIVDARKMSVGRKLREAGQLWSLVTAVIGKKEAETGLVTLRVRENGEQIAVKSRDLPNYIKNMVPQYSTGTYSFLRIFE
ncbi:MAG: hypothetical protein F7C32_04255 [Desulfurococcales archaeon]|nr:hypothetical protein [Desulfurococcales archaeon]